MARFRTIGQRRGRARKAQVSAIAVVLSLLLIVSFIANFITTQLPGEMSQIEFQHIVQVRDQLARFQATILAEALENGPKLAVPSPVTLGSDSVPPFGPPVSSSITPLPSEAQSTSYTAVSKIFPAPPKWNQGTDPCSSGTSGTPCSANGNIQFWNFSQQNNTSLKIKVSGGNNGLVYNFTGNNDTITITWTGKDTRFVLVNVNGSDNVVNYIKSGSDTLGPVVQFNFWGQRDVFTFSPSGSHSSGGSMQIGVQFVGQLRGTCPYANLAATDRVGTLGTGGSNINMTVVWWNSIGFVTAPHVEAYPGGALPTERLAWQNNSAPVECAFEKSFPSAYRGSYGGGINVHINNQYTPQANVAYEQGAVILAEAGGQAVMASPPAFNFTPVPGGFNGRVTLVDFVGNPGGQAGIATAALVSQVLSVASVTLVGGSTQISLISAFLLNITTLYPSAWMSYFNGNPFAFPFSATCSSSVVIATPYSCTNPPPGVAVTVTAPFTVESLVLTVITVAVSID